MKRSKFWSFILIAVALTVAVPPRASADRDKEMMIICHLPKGNTDEMRTLNLESHGAANHLKQHADDHMGACETLGLPPLAPEPEIVIVRLGDSYTEGALSQFSTSRSSWRFAFEQKLLQAIGAVNCGDIGFQGKMLWESGSGLIVPAADFGLGLQTLCNAAGISFWDYFNHPSLPFSAWGGVQFESQLRWKDSFEAANLGTDVLSCPFGLCWDIEESVRAGLGANLGADAPLGDPYCNVKYLQGNDSCPNCFSVKCRSQGGYLINGINPPWRATDVFVWLGTNDVLNPGHQNRLLDPTRGCHYSILAAGRNYREECMEDPVRGYRAFIENIAARLSAERSCAGGDCRIFLIYPPNVSQSIADQPDPDIGGRAMSAFHQWLVETYGADHLSPTQVGAATVVPIDVEGFLRDEGLLDACWSVTADQGSYAIVDDIHPAWCPGGGTDCLGTITSTDTTCYGRIGSFIADAAIPYIVGAP